MHNALHPQRRFLSARAAVSLIFSTLSYGGFLLGPPIIGCIAEYLTLRGGLGVVVGLALVFSGLAPFAGNTFAEAEALTQ